MNREETHALWRQGKDAWNAWAEKMLAERKRLQEAGEWAAERNPFFGLQPKNDPTKAWMATASADFSSAEQPFTFEEDVDFSGWKFPGYAGFSEAAFSGNARFGKAAFSGDAGFGKAAFSGNAGFNKAAFSGNAWFYGAAFSGDAGFEKAAFSENAWFNGAAFSGNAGFNEAAFSGYAGFLQSVFKGYTSFANARFKGPANFTAASIESAFSLEKAIFDRVPDFTQTHCSEAPRLDNSHFRRGLVEPRSFWGTIVKAPNENVTSHYRSLKRLAIQAHDHDKEQEFFAGELRTRRNTVDKWWHARWWFGVLYELLSDFGRSMLRPFLIWLVATVLFAGVYLGEHLARAGQRAYGSVWDWAFNGWHLWLKAVGAWPGLIDYPALARAVPGPALACVAGGSDVSSPLLAALGVSLRKGLLFAGLGDSDKASQDYSCLYGLDTALMEKVGNSQLVRVVPDSVAYWGLAQTILSIVLIFLFLLAVRNHFKIK